MKMRTFTKAATAVGATLALAACASDFDVAGTSALEGPTAFGEALNAGYAKSAQWEQDEGDWIRSVALLDKAKAAAAGETVAPDDAPNAELAEARTALLAHLDNGARDQAPMSAAQAQVAYDCLAHEAWEGHEEDDMHDCPAAYGRAMAALDAAMAADMTPAPQPAPDMPAPAVVFFPLDKAGLTADAHRVIEAAAAAYAEVSPATVQVLGWADTSGNAPYNLALAQSRADTVAAALDGAGVPRDKIRMTAYGETNLPVTTPDGVANAQNRRVEIRFAAK